jgi:hypothetical protein
MKHIRNGQPSHGGDHKTFELMTSPLISSNSSKERHSDQFDFISHSGFREELEEKDVLKITEDTR